MLLSDNLNYRPIRFTLVLTYSLLKRIDSIDSLIDSIDSCYFLNGLQEQYITQNPGSSAPTQLFLVLYTWDELIMSLFMCQIVPQI